MGNPITDDAFANYVNQAGLANEDQLDEARSMQATANKYGNVLSLADALVMKGTITAAHKENVERKIQSQLEGIKQLGNFKLIEKLGEGGMGAVYLADDTLAGRKVALKVLSPRHASDPEYLQRFRREARAAGRLNHLNIVTAFSVGEELGSHYYVMEYCEGEALDVRLKRELFLSGDQAIQIVMQVASGLKYAHEHGVIHRDIKPANIFVTRDGVAKILDLGLSKNIVDENQSFNTETGVTMGTPHYISPEQVRGDKAIDGRTDIYSLGAMFYHLVTGQTPFQGATAAIIVMGHMSGNLPDPRETREDIPAGIVQVIQKMMAKNAAERYSDCSELLDDLERVMDGKMPAIQAVEAGKPTVATRQKLQAPVATTIGYNLVDPYQTREERKFDSKAPPSSKRTMYLWLSGLGAAVLILTWALIQATQGNAKPKETQAPDAGAMPLTPAIPAVVMAEEKKPGDLNPKNAASALAAGAALPKELRLDLGGGVEMELVLMPAGTFKMGSLKIDGGRQDDEMLHPVTIGKAFYMGKYTVTQPQYEVVTKKKPSHFTGEKNPVERVSWFDAAEFCKMLNTGLKPRLPAGMEIQLPTEAQWEYACRAGTATRYYFGEEDSKLGDAAWYRANGSKHAHPVGEKNANAFGLYDMYGNVWQWCNDFYAKKYYEQSPDADPPGPVQGDPYNGKDPARVLRGGSWLYDTDLCRSAFRFKLPPGYRGDDVGFRVVMVPSTPGKVEDKP